MRLQYDGTGIVLGAGLAGIDLDNCVNSNTLEIKPWASSIINHARTYFEFSPSRTGEKGFGWGKLPGPGKNRDVDGKSIEVYDSARFFTVTGDQVPGRTSDLADIQPVLESLYQEILDAELVDKASRAKNGAKFGLLWSGDWKGYPSLSEADLALLQFLVNYSDSDNQILRLWRKSGLNRPHLDSDDYVTRTLAKAKATHLNSRTDSSVGDMGPRTISDTTDAVSFILSRAGCPNECRCLIDAVIGVSNGESVHWFDAPDLAVGQRMIGADSDPAHPASVSKRVQRHRKRLKDWQDESGYLLIECQSGGKDKNGNNHATRYRLPLLAAAVELLHQAHTLAKISCRPLKKELQEGSRMAANQLIGRSTARDRFFRPRRDDLSEFNRRLKSAVTNSVYCLDMMAEERGYPDIDHLMAMLRKSIEERRAPAQDVSHWRESDRDELGVS
ncbi:MAG: hypothetical protein WAU45_23840 [Blastocatellia bacterium]